MQVVELKAALKARNLSPNGMKADLVSRLKQSFAYNTGWLESEWTALTPTATELQWGYTNKFDVPAFTGHGGQYGRLRWQYIVGTLIEPSGAHGRGRRQTKVRPCPLL